MLFNPIIMNIQFYDVECDDNVAEKITPSKGNIGYGNLIQIYWDTCGIPWEDDIGMINTGEHFKRCAANKIITCSKCD